MLACLADELELLNEKTNGHFGDVMSLVFSPDGTKIVTRSCRKTIIVWDSGAP